MKRLQFNFNNEVDTFEIMKDEETGRITVPGPDGPLATYDNMQQFAELYAQARDVKNENLKNWTLVENGDVVSFVLRAGTAGITAAAIRNDLNEILEAMRANGAVHPLVVERVKRELADSEDVVTSLALSPDADCAREVYDRLAERNLLMEPEVEPEPEPEVDQRSDMERFLDRVMENDNSLVFIARLMNLDATATKELILESVSQSVYSVEMLANLYEQAIQNVRHNYGVDTRMEALMVLTQTVPQAQDEDAKAKLINTARMAHRDKLSLFVYEVGRKHIRKEQRTLTVMDVSDANIYLFGNQPAQVVFNDLVDADIERERLETADAEDEYDEDGYDDEYDDEDDEY